MRRLGLAMVGLMLAGCATGGLPQYHVAPDLQLGSWPYMIGPVTVMLLESQSAVDATCRSQAARAGRSMPSHPIRGCYFVAGGREYVVSIPDVGVVLHEFKHVLEGAWHP